MEQLAVTFTIDWQDSLERERERERNNSQITPAKIVLQMEVGALGHHGGVAAFRAEMEFRHEQENVTVPRLRMVE